MHAIGFAANDETKYLFTITGHVGKAKNVASCKFDSTLVNRGK